jgi:uncharacterized membrane protein YebE (DUF533 family)
MLRAMIDPKALLDRFLGAGTADRAAGALSSADQKLSGMGVPGGLAGAAAGAGLLALLVGGKAGKVARYGGAAALGALAYRAWQSWQQGQTAPSAPPQPAEIAATDTRFLPHATTGADGQPFALALIRGMIGAAKADGHVDAEESRRIFEAVERSGLGAEEKAAIFQAMNAPSDPAVLAAAAATPEQAAELWLAARLAVTPDHPAERAFLDALAHRLNLNPGLRGALEQQAAAAHASG